MANVAENAEEKIPSWLNADLIEKALHNDGEKNYHVKSTSVYRATAPGDNYLSVIHRVKAELSDGRKRVLLVKCLPASEDLVKFLKETDTFEREGEMLGDIIPRMQAILEDGAPGRWKPLAARCPLYGTNPTFLVLEDLSQQGFKMADRKRGLGLRHSLLAIRNLARYHASSHAILKQDPTLYEKMRTCQKTFEKLDFLIQFIEDGLEGASEACRTWPGFEEYAEILEKIKPNIREKFRICCKSKPESFEVIVHGDYWSNNMMFSYDDNGFPCDQRILDFQIIFVAAAALDVVFFLCLTPSETVYSHYEDLLIREYHYALEETLTVLGYQTPTLSELFADKEAHGLMSLAALVSIPLVKADKSADFDGALAGDKEALKIIYTMPTVQTAMQRNLLEMKRKGWFV